MFQKSVKELAEVQKREFKSQRTIQRNDERDGKKLTKVGIVLLKKVIEKGYRFLSCIPITIKINALIVWKWFGASDLRFL